MMFGIQDVMIDPLAFEQGGKFFGLLNGYSSNKNRSAFLIKLLDLLNDSVKFLLFRLVDNIGIIPTDHGHMCWDDTY